MNKDNVLTTVVFSVLVTLFVLVASDWRMPWSAPDRPVGIAWCEPHDVQLDMCETCNPALARGGTQVVQSGDPLPGQCPNTCVRITLGDGVAERIGLKLETIETRPVEERFRANAETQFLPGNYARIAPRSDGTICEVRASVGDEVAEGNVLAVVASPELGRAKSDYLRDLSTQKLRKTLHLTTKEAYPKITTLRQMAAAESELEEANLAVALDEQRLTTLGLSEEQIASVKETGNASPMLEVRSPFSGRVVSATAVRGEAAGPDQQVFGIADMSRMWLVIDLLERDLLRVEPGQRVRFYVDGLPGKRFPGKIIAIGGEVDDRTRTVRVYANVKNREDLLKANMFGEVEIRIRPAEPKLLIPRDAVQNDGDCLLAFISTSRDTYIPRALDIGAIYEGGYEVVGGLAAGDRVVTVGSFLLKTEILRGQIGAG